MGNVYYICVTIVIMAERIDYSKETVKGKSTSIRFIEKHLDLVKEVEGLKTPQQVVDFLLNKYWFEKQFGNNPILLGLQRSFIEESEIVKIAENATKNKHQPNKIKKEVYQVPNPQIVTLERYPGRNEGESLIDYQIRMAESKT